MLLYVYGATALCGSRLTCATFGDWLFLSSLQNDDDTDDDDTGYDTRAAEDAATGHPLADCKPNESEGRKGPGCTRFGNSQGR